MTTMELMRIKRLWDAGLPVKQIAHATGYTQNSIYFVGAQHRDLFPRRHKRDGSYDEETKAMWVKRVRSGESSISGAARECGVARGTMRKWVRELA